MPDIDYTAKDYLGFREFLLNRKKALLPEWTSEAPGDFGIVLIELFSYMGDILSFYGDRTATEAYLSTATQRRSILALAEMLDYTVTNNVPATVDVTFNVSADVTIPAGTQVQTSNRAAIEAGDDAVVFEVIEDTLVTTPSGQVPCIEGQTVAGEVVATSDGSIDQTYSLFRFPVIDNSVRVFVDEGGGDVEWTEFDHLIDAASTSEAFEVSFDAEGAADIRFGDNVNGRVPSAGATVKVTYRIGGGVRGNVGPATVVELVTAIPEVTSITNSESAAGGADAESNDQIRVSAPRSLTALNRAVTLKDYANIALQVSGVAKTVARNNGTEISVHVAPFGGGTLSPKKTVRAASVGNLTLSGEQTVDGIALVAGDRVLVKDQTAAAENGVYDVVAAAAWTRSADFNEGSEFPGALVYVQVGLDNANTSWTCTNSTAPVLGTDPVTWASSTNLGDRGRVWTYLDVRKMINHTVAIDDPTYLPLTVAIDVVVLPNYSRAAVANAVENAVNQMLKFSNVDFAYRVSVSRVYDIVQSVSGVDYADITELSSDGLGGVADVIPATTEIPTVGTTTINATGGIVGT